MERDTFPKLLARHAEERGARPALREKSRGIWHTLSWRELADEAMALAAALAAQGVRPGGHVALVGDNRPRLYVAICAVHSLGAVAVPLYQDAGAAELAAPIRHAGVTHVFAENQEQVDKLLELQPACPDLRCIVYDDDRGMRHYRQQGLVSYAALLQQGRDALGQASEALAALAARGSGGDAAFVFYTSGTTGPAKGVVLTHAALIDRARALVETEGLTDADVALAYLPPGWIGQNLFSYAQPMVAGLCVCCPESSETLLADMREIGPSVLLAPPRMLETLATQVSLRIEGSGRFERGLYGRCLALARRVGARILDGLEVPLADRIAYAAADVAIYGPLRDVLGMSRVRVAFAAGDAIEPELLMFFRAIGINLKQLYGSTETGMLVAAQRNGQVKPGSVGTPSPRVELRLTEQREILVRSPGLFREYLGDPEATARALGPDGWFHTGDAGRLDDDGHLQVIDRLKNLGALSDGTPYVPKPIENRLKLADSIREAVVLGHGRDRVCALIDIDFAAVGDWANKRGLSYTGHADLASLPEVHARVAADIAEVNAALARDPQHARAQIHRFAILTKELDADDGVLTRTGKLRREAIADRYRAVIDALYGGQTGAALADGSELKLVDVPTARSEARATPATSAATAAA